VNKTESDVEGNEGSVNNQVTNANRVSSEIWLMWP